MYKWGYFSFKYFTIMVRNQSLFENQTKNKEFGYVKIEIKS